MPHKIIVADPSPTVQRIAQSVFPETEFRLFPIEDGAELMTAVEGLRPDAILISLSLGGLDGYDAARVLRRQADTRRTPIFFLKGAFELLDPGRIAGIEHDGLFVKPFDSEMLVADVRRAIEKRTTPTSFPEEPLWAGIEGGMPEAGAPREDGPSPAGPARGRNSRAEVPGELSRSDGPPAPHSRVREWVRAEVGELERELEKRIRARILAELRDVPDGGGKPVKK